MINVVSKRPQLEQYNALTVRGSTYGSGKNGSGGGFDSTGALGDSNFAYRLIVDHEDEDYWRNYGVHRESLVAPSLAWLGEDTQVVLAYEHREFLYPSTVARRSATTATRWTSLPRGAWTSPSTTWKGAPTCTVWKSTTSLPMTGSCTSATASTAKPMMPARCG